MTGLDLSGLDTQSVLARTLWGEARGEGNRGIQAVANVIVNRANAPKWWGADIRSVCLKPYQFSCWNMNDPNRAKLLAVDDSDTLYSAALDIAGQAIAGSLADITSGATSYYASGSVKPIWADHVEPCAVIGHHLFFKV